MRDAMKNHLPIRKILTPAAILCGAVLPLSTLHAAPAGKLFGGFKSSQKFTLTVQEVTSSQSVGSKVKSTAPVPEGIPKFRKGQKVTVKIGKKGEWTGPGFSIPLLNSTSAVNSYSKQPTSKTVSPNVATVAKDSKGKPVATTMVFYRYRITDFTADSLTINRVGYILK